MRNLRPFTLALLVLAGFLGPAAAQGSFWTDATVGLLRTDDDWVIALDVERTAAGTLLLNTVEYGGLYRSTDDGAHWAPVFAHWPASRRVFGLYADPSGFALVGLPDGLYRSEDDGQTWARVPTGGNAGPTLFGVAPDGTLLALGGDGPRRSTDGGLTWTTAPPLPASASSISRVGDVLFLGAGSRGLYRSEDGGLTWAASGLNTFTPYGAVVAWGGALYTTAVKFNGSVYRGSVFRSTDGGHTWTAVFAYDSHDLSAFRNLTVSPSGALYASGARLYRSDDATTWTLQLDAVGEALYDLLVYEEDGVEQTVAAGFGSGVRTRSGAEGWTTANAGIVEIAEPLRFDETRGGVWLGTERGLYRADAGVAWDAVDGPTDPTEVAGLDGDRVVAVTDADVRVGPADDLRSIRPAGYHEFRFASAGRDGRIHVFANPTQGGPNTLLSTPDEGATWTSRPFPDYAGAYGRSAAVFASSGTTVATVYLPYPQGGHYELFRGPGGGPWQSAPVTTGTRLSELDAATVALAGPASLAFSEDDGVTWQARSTLNTKTRVVTSPAGALFTSDGTAVYRSDDAGYTWLALPPLPVGVQVTDVYADDAGFVYAGTDGGVFRSEEAVVVAAEGTPPSTGALALDAPAPNPFAAATTLRFSLPAAGAVRLDVYDVLGRRVTTLVDGVLTPGAHTATWTPTGVAGGTYVAVLRAGDATAVRRLLLQR